MLTIRLARGGAKKRPFYHIVATDSRNSRDGRCVERLGYFNPVARGEELRLSIEEDRLNYWLSVGATTSDKVSTLLKEKKKRGIQTGKAVIERKASARSQVLAAKKRQLASEVVAEETAATPADASTE